MSGETRATNIHIRNYNPATDYQQVASLYKDTSAFGGQFDRDRDSEERLRMLSGAKPDCILVAMVNDTIVGTVSILEDARAAWLIRFAVKKEFKGAASKHLLERAREVLKDRGHNQVLVYAPDDARSDSLYTALGFNKGNAYRVWWEMYGKK